MSEQEENELICEKLLGLKKHCNSPECRDWRNDKGLRYWVRPDFTDWSGAVLILDRAKALNKAVILYVHDENSRWEASINNLPTRFADTGPLAIRAAALAYIRSLS